jgi:hypothetical protein
MFNGKFLDNARKRVGLLQVIWIYKFREKYEKFQTIAGIQTSNDEISRKRTFYREEFDEEYG